MTDYERQELEAPTEPLQRVEPMRRRGGTFLQVERAQAWLTLHGFSTAIDGDYGPATEAAVRRFQVQRMAEDNPPAVLGEVDARTWAALVAPLERAVHAGEVFAGVEDVGARIVAIAEYLLAQQIREVGGPNEGAWVRWLMKGKEGKAYPWCAGFATTVLRLALGHGEWDTFSCDELALKALWTPAFMRAPGPGERSQVAPGDVFLLRHPAPSGIYRRPDWYHTGIVTRVEPGGEAFHTAEGNTNAGGSPEGTAALARVRAFKDNVDFIRMGVAHAQGK